MTTNRKYSLALLSVLLVFPVRHALGDPTLTLIPANGVISGAPGSTIGWGFTIINTTDFLEVTSSTFMPATLLGTYTDFTQFNFIVVGPAPESTTVTQNFNAVAQTGIGSFTISPSAPAGSSAVGQIEITYDLFSVSPNDPGFDPTINTISTDNFLCASPGPSAVCGNAQVNVNAVPEPNTVTLMAVLAGLFGYGVSRGLRKPPIARRTIDAENFG